MYTRYTMSEERTVLRVDTYRLIFALLAATALAYPPAVAAQTTIAWAERLYNPKALKDDLIIPVPCDGAMAFRPAITEASGPLGDQRIEVGSNAEDAGYVEHTRPDFVAGPFQTDSPDGRRLLVGKYEVTELQYLSVMSLAAGEPCPAANARGRLPRTQVSWHDAAAFAHNLSLWLREHADDLPACREGAGPCLPRQEGVPAFLRLPTEAEWEYVVRGGASVTPADFREPTYPMPEGMERYVWFNETAGGELKPIGLLAPNPLGLHDMLGNAEEIALEPFRLNRLDRLHGQPGGYVVRGGSYHSGLGEIRSSMRREVPFYDDRGAVKTSDTGFRLVASVPVIRSQPVLAEIRSAWDALGADETNAEPRVSDETPVPDRPFDDPLLELSALARAVPDPTLKERLQGLRSVVAANAQRLYGQRNRAAREALRFGGLLCQKLHDEGHNMEVRRARQRLCVDGLGPDHERCRKGEQTLEANREVLLDNIRFFADSIVRTAQNYAEDLGVLEEQVRILEGEMERRGVERLTVYPNTFHTQVLSYAYEGQVKRDAWYETCAELQ